MIIKRVIVGLLKTNCYILENDNECLIIDPGSDFNKIQNNVNKRVVGILLTHNHFDHIGALNELERYYNIKHMDYNNLKEGFNKMGCFNFMVRYNFGHTMDSVSYIFDDKMFSGDFIFKGNIGRCDYGGDFRVMKKSIKELLKSDINYKIYPGHGETTYLFNEKDILIKYLGG